MLLDFQSGHNHNATSRITEKVADRCGVVRQIVQAVGTDPAADTNAGLKVTQYGYTDKIFQCETSIDDDNMNFQPANSTALDLNDHTTATTPATLCFKLVSGILANERYIPLLALKGAGLTLEITLAASNNAICFTGTSDETSAYTLSNVEYIASTIDVSDAYT